MELGKWYKFYYKDSVGVLKQEVGSSENYLIGKPIMLYGGLDFLGDKKDCEYINIEEYNINVIEMTENDYPEYYI